MVTVTLAVPEELKKQMDALPEMNWSEVARQAFRQRIADLALLHKMKEKSTLTEKEALELGAELSKKLAKRYA